MDDPTRAVLDRVDPRELIDLASALIRIPSFKTEETAVARFLEKVLEIAETAPKRASVSLSRILVPITLVPVKDPDGTRRYEARGALNTNPAALVAQGGRESVYGSCGGEQVAFSTGFTFRISV